MLCRGNDIMQKRLTAHFSGMVQGVGFRFTAERIARRFDVTGCVRNLSDGRVEIVAEGEEAVLKDFLRAVGESPMADYIRRVETEWSGAKRQYKTFGIAA